MGDGSDRSFYAKIAGSVLAFAFGAYLFVGYALAAHDPQTGASIGVFAGGLITAGLAGFGVNIGATVQSGREARLLASLRSERARKAGVTRASRRVAIEAGDDAGEP